MRRRRDIIESSSCSCSSATPRSTNTPKHYPSGRTVRAAISSTDSTRRPSVPLAQLTSCPPSAHAPAELDHIPTTSDRPVLPPRRRGRSGRGPPSPPRQSAPRGTIRSCRSPQTRPHGHARAHIVTSLQIVTETSQTLRETSYT